MSCAAGRTQLLVVMAGGTVVAAELRAFGYEVRERETLYFPLLNAVAVLPDGTFRGAGEPRWSESAAGGPRR